MKRLAYLSAALCSLPLVACYGGDRANGGCPAGETCSAATPNGLLFIGRNPSDQLNLSGPLATVIGGTQDVQLDFNDDALGAFDLPYTAKVDAPTGVNIDATSGSTVTITGTGTDANYVRIVDPNGELYDRKQMTGASIDTVALLPAAVETIPSGMDISFATSNEKYVVALTGRVEDSVLGEIEERLVDDSMQLTLAGSLRVGWDAFSMPGATAGVYSLDVSSGDYSGQPVGLVIVDHIDSLAVQSDAPTTVAQNGSVIVCFTASSSGRYVAGLDWSFTVNGQAAAAFGSNCANVYTSATSGTVTVKASVAGMNAQTMLAIGPSSRQVPHQQPRAWREPAGERAAD